MPPKSSVFSKGQLYLQGCAYFNFSRHFLIHYAKIPFCPQPWKEDVKMDLSEIHDSCYCHRRESIPYLINHGHVLYHTQDCEKDVVQMGTGKPGRMISFQKRNIIVLSVSNFQGQRLNYQVFINHPLLPLLLPGSNSW